MGGRLEKDPQDRLGNRAKTRPLGFGVLPRRWVVERTFAGLFNYRVHAKDYEVLTANSEAFIHMAMIHLLLKNPHHKRVLKTLLRVPQAVRLAPEAVGKERQAANSN